MTVLVFQSNNDHGLHNVANSDCELRIHITKSDEDGGYFLQGLAVDITTEEQQADAWYAFNELVSSEDAFETVGAAVGDCAWFTGGRWIFTELPDAVNCAKLFADALGVKEATPTSKREQLITDLERAEGLCNRPEIDKLRRRLNTEFPGWDDEELGREPRTNQTASLTIEFSGSLADSLRAIANLVEEYGPAFLSDPTAFYGIHNDGTVHRVDIDLADKPQVVVPNDNNSFASMMNRKSGR